MFNSKRENIVVVILVLKWWGLIEELVRIIWGVISYIIKKIYISCCLERDCK